jgi:hypothetical protein
MAGRQEDSRAIDVSAQIRIVGGQRVLLDADLAALYGVTTKRLNQQVRRNHTRFPPDFAIGLTNQDIANLRLQIATSSLQARGWGGRRYHATAFTEHGASMAATIQNSPRAVEMSVYVVRAFVKARELLHSHDELTRELALLKKSVATLDADTRRQFDQVFEAILGLMNPAPNRQ